MGLLIAPSTITHFARTKDHPWWNGAAESVLGTLIVFLDDHPIDNVVAANVKKQAVRIYAYEKNGVPKLRPNGKRKTVLLHGKVTLFVRDPNGKVD